MVIVIRFSLVIQNENGEFLLCKTADTSEQKRYAFPGGKLETDILPPFETFLEYIHDTMLKSMSINICDIERIELYLREEPFFVHTVFSARITSGIPTAIGYSNVCWVSVDKIDMDSLNIYGLQVIQKIKECGYCQFLYKRREEIDSFFKNYFSKSEENITILDALDVTNSNHSLYMIAFKQEMVHLRASLIENVKL